MTVGVAYCWPNLNVSKYAPLAKRFADTYRQFPPGSTPTELYVIGNGPELGNNQKQLFGSTAKGFLQHNNFGRDIGAFIRAADVIQCDLLVCFGAHVYFWKAGWMDQIMDAFLDNGPGVYGAWAFHEPRPHIRTTAFWCPKELLSGYPYVIGDHQRYGFEHGPDSITLWSQRSGFDPMMVTWRGCFGVKDWHHVERDECLFLDQHTERIGYK